MGLNQLTPALTNSYQLPMTSKEPIDISQALDKVWHQGVILRLKQNGISGMVYQIIAGFLLNKYRRIVLNGQSSGWTALNTGVP